MSPSKQCWRYYLLFNITIYFFSLLMGDIHKVDEDDKVEIMFKIRLEALEIVNLTCLQLFLTCVLAFAMGLKHNAGNRRPMLKYSSQFLWEFWYVAQILLLLSLLLMSTETANRFVGRRFCAFMIVMCFGLIWLYNKAYDIFETTEELEEG